MWPAPPNEFETSDVTVYLDHFCRTFLYVKAATALAHLSHRNSVHLSVTQVDQSKTAQAKITESLPSATWKALVSGTMKLFLKI